VEKTKTRTWDDGIITETERTTFDNGKCNETTFDNGKYNETVRVKKDGFVTHTISKTYTTGKSDRKK
jgi:hypothetical protein